MRFANKFETAIHINSYAILSINQSNHLGCYKVDIKYSQYKSLYLSPDISYFIESLQNILIAFPS